MRRPAALLALVAMMSALPAQAEARATTGALARENRAPGEIGSTTTGHAGSVLWTQKDPLGFAAGDTSLYVYALGDPITYVDPDGELCWIPLIFLAIKGIDFAMNAWDTYELAKKLMDPCISSRDKATELALLAAQWIGGKVLGKVLHKLQKSNFVSKFGCFVAGTLVATQMGLVPIEMIEPGAIVRAWNESTGETEWRTVTANHLRSDVATLAIGIEDERQGSWALTTTAEHPIYVASVGYVPAARLEPGQWLVTESGAWSRVVSVAPTGAMEAVYNLTVEGTENYFVGPSPVLVHNTDVRCGNPPINISPKGLKHTVDRHTDSGLAEFANKSKFNAGENVEDLVRNGTHQKMTPQPNGNFARTFDAGRNIGVDRSTGSQTSIMTIITRASGELVTAFPGRP